MLLQHEGNRGGAERDPFVSAHGSETQVGWTDLAQHGVIDLSCDVLKQAVIDDSDVEFTP